MLLQYCLQHLRSNSDVILLQFDCCIITVTTHGLADELYLVVHGCHRVLSVASLRAQQGAMQSKLTRLSVLSAEWFVGFAATLLAMLSNIILLSLDVLC